MLDGMSPRHGARTKARRAGRGPGTRHNKTNGRGTKGQGKRVGGREVPLYSEGGQMPIVRRLPKRGFRSQSHTGFRIVNVGTLGAFDANASIDPAALEAAGLIHRSHLEVKLLAEGTPPAGLKVRVHKASAAATQKIEAAGGTVELIS
jgi:large subunit ribosomal protein L15